MLTVLVAVCVGTVLLLQYTFALILISYSFMHARPQLSPAVQPLLTRTQLESAPHPLGTSLRWPAGGVADVR